MHRRPRGRGWRSAGGRWPGPGSVVADACAAFAGGAAGRAQAAPMTSLFCTELAALDPGRPVIVSSSFRDSGAWWWPVYIPRPRTRSSPPDSSTDVYWRKRRRRR